MQEKTRRGVYHDLTKSPFTTTRGALTFVFSSEYNKRRFCERVAAETERFNARMEERSKMGLSSNMQFLPAIILYNTIESRGFLIRGSMFGYEWTWNSAADVVIGDIPESI